MEPPSPHIYSSSIETYVDMKRWDNNKIINFGLLSVYLHSQA